MTRHGSFNSSTVHPSGGTPETTAPKCCARCRRGTPATGLGECGYGSAGCPNEKCGCHKTLRDQVIELAAETLSREFDRTFFPELFTETTLGGTNEQ